MGNNPEHTMKRRNNPEEQAERAYELALQGLQVGQEAAKRQPDNDLPGQQEAWQAATDAHIRYQVATALLREEITEEQEQDIVEAIDGDGHAAHRLNPEVNPNLWPPAEL